MTIGNTELAYREAVAANLRAYRARCHLSQTAVADGMRELGFRWHQETVSSAECCERPVRAEEIIGLAKVLGTLPSALLTH